MLAVLYASCGGRTAGGASQAEEDTLALNVTYAYERLEQFVFAARDSLHADRMASQYYKEQGPWLWAARTEQLGQAHQLHEYLQSHVGDMGFAPQGFFLDTIASDLQRLDSLAFDATYTPREVMARLELNLTRAYLRYARGQRYGFMDNPRRVFNHLDLRKPDRPGDYRQLFDVPMERPDSTFAPTALAQAARGRALEYLSTVEPRDTIYQKLQAALATTGDADQRRLLLCNMERRRWRDSIAPQTDDARYVLVNIAAQQLWAVRPDSVFAMRICCGAWKTKTPLLSSRIARIELNPEWNIPSSIVRDEVSHHAGDSAYFARNHYFIIDRHTADTIDPRDITARQLQSGRYRVAQHSGPVNSLGRIIFRFPNEFAVYLHDTNNRQAFNAERRTISHGCVRVQRPFDLALFLLPGADEWTLDRMRLSMDLKPESDKGREFLEQRAQEEDTSPVRLIRSVGVEPRVPVYLAYYTAYPNPLTGELETWRDRYEYDQHIARALKPFMP